MSEQNPKIINGDFPGVGMRSIQFNCTADQYEVFKLAGERRDQTAEEYIENVLLVFASGVTEVQNFKKTKSGEVKK